MFAPRQEVNYNPERGPSSFSSSTPKDKRSLCYKNSSRIFWLLLINTTSFLLFYNGKVINSWTLAKTDKGLHYLFHSSYIPLIQSFPSFPCNKQALPFQMAPSTLHQGTRKLSTKHDTVPTCLAHLVLIKPERAKVAAQGLWLRAKYVLVQIGHRVHF